MTGLNLPQPPLHPYGGPSDGLARWSSVDLARLSPCGWKNGFRWPAAFPCGPLCGTECKFPRPAEWLPSSLPLLVEPASSRLSTGPLRTASSGCAACPPDTARRICGWPPDSPRSRYRDQTSRPCAPCRTCVRPCAESSPSTASLLATAVPPHHRPLPVHRRARRILPPPGYHRSDSPWCAIIHSNTGRSRSSIELALSSFQGGLPITQSYWVAYASPAQDAFGSNEFPSKTFRLRSVGTRLSSTT